MSNQSIYEHDLEAMREELETVLPLLDGYTKHGSKSRKVSLRDLKTGNHYGLDENGLLFCNTTGERLPVKDTLRKIVAGGQAALRYGNRITKDPLDHSAHKYADMFKSLNGNAWEIFALRRADGALFSPAKASVYGVVFDDIEDMMTVRASGYPID